MRFSAVVAASVAAVLIVPAPAFAWGAVGHRMINNVAARSLPASVPAFVRTPEAIAEITTLGPEADRLRNAEKPYGPDFDPAHFLDVDDDLTVAGVVPLAQLPPDRESFDTALRKGHPIEKRSPDEYVTGYLPYAIADGYAAVEEDFAIWRLDAYGETHGASPDDRAAFAYDRKLREILTLRDIGYFGHFVADGSQPLHDSVHYNGWGDFPNPNNYTNSHQIHAKFETAFVNKNETPDLILSRMGTYTPSSAPILTRVGAYLAKTAGYVPDVYKLEAAGALDAATPAAVNFTADRLADGAKMLRDLIADAYTNAGNTKIYPATNTINEIENGVAPPVPYSSFKG